MENVRNNEKARSASIGTFIICVAASVILGVAAQWLGGMFSGYGDLVISQVTPSVIVNIIFWSISYFLMGWALYLTMANRTVELQGLKTTAIVIWLGQFLFSLAFPFILFYGNVYTFAFIWSAILVAMITAYVIMNLWLSVPASLLMLPYWVFMLFTTYSTLIIALYN